MKNNVWTRDDFRIVRDGRKFYVEYLGTSFFLRRPIWKPAFSYTSFDGGDVAFSTQQEAEKAIQDSLAHQGTEIVG